MGSSQIFLRTGSDHLDPVVVIFFLNAKKNTTTGSSANFLSPDSNGQGYREIFIQNHK